ncbi:glucose dehydrogenase [FAD, quinone]-like [Diorhabda carinulata]|uniref:glucose dehydrogenase [FAD, quinone]-like n=1 Tax=Diorhabda carinulata TaxID=1163345 RepID=UPI0025A1938B|nr:glucose dehydrogenase [FAD, quinone]-like [Diorhabda carinulata]
MLQVIVLSLLLFTSTFGLYDEDIVQDYVKLITETLETSRKYEHLDSSRNYEALKSGPPKVYGVFDFIVVGSGSTGSVVASRLSEILDWKVLVLEAGEFGNNVTEITAMAYKATINSEYNWGYYSIPQKNSCLGFKESRCPHIRGKGVGGTSLINALIYTKGNRHDFDKWCALGNKNWCYKDVLPYFLKSENFNPTDPTAPVEEEYHGYRGVLNVEHPMPRTRHSQIFLEASEAMGYPIRDVNGKNQTGVMAFQINTKCGRRQDSGTAFLRPVMYRRNLKVLTNSLVTKILIKDREAKGVLFLNKGILYEAIARKEVIVCGGTINSPQLLMLSGIGPKKHLQEHNIPVVQDLAVGNSFSDHLQVYGLTFSTNYTEPVSNLREAVVNYLYKGTDYLAEALSSQAVGYYQTHLEPIENYPDIEISISDTNITIEAMDTYVRMKEDIKYVTKGIDGSNSFIMHVTPLRTKSLGTIRLKSSDPLEYPIIDPNILSDPEGYDLESVYLGIELALNLTKQEPFKRINAKLELKPLKQCNKWIFMSREYWKCASRYLVSHNNHPVGTCKMGPNPKQGDVVDNELKVYGIKKLRVADASVIPLSTSSHINGVCYMIGEKLADIIKTTYNKI